MNSALLFFMGILKITILDLALSGDNIGIIALATKDLDRKYAKKASMIGIGFAIGLRILFACCITFMLSIRWLPIKLIGGLLLVKITFDFIKPHNEEDGEVKSSNRFWGAVTTIVIADLTMSLDNVLAIASAADGKVILIVFGILLNIPIIFFGSQFVSRLIEKYELVIYIAGAILAHTSIKMILEDSFVLHYVHISHIMINIIPLIFTVLVIAYGIFNLKKEDKLSKAA